MRALKVKQVEARRVTLEFMPEDLERLRRLVECNVTHPEDEAVATNVKAVIGEIYDMVITYPEVG